MQTKWQPYPWQQASWQQFQQLFFSGRMPNSLLLHGLIDSGIPLFIRQAVQLLLCTGKQAPCGQCDSCKWVYTDSHPDLLWVEPEAGGRQIKIEQIRELIEFMELKSFARRSKVCVIHPAEAMNRATANALLKTLEEPLENDFLLLVSYSPEKLLPTIRSRCQRHSVAVVPDENTWQWISEQCAVTAAEAKQLLLAAGGSPLAAVVMQQEGTLKQRQDFLQQCQALIEHRASVLQLATEWDKRDAVSQVMEYLLLVLHASIHSKLTAEVVTESDGITSDLQKYLKGLKLIQLLRCYEQTQRNYGMLSHTANLNARALLEEVLFFWQENLIVEDTQNFH